MKLAGAPGAAWMGRRPTWGPGPRTRGSPERPRRSRKIRSNPAHSRRIVAASSFSAFLRGLRVTIGTPGDDARVERPRKGRAPADPAQEGAWASERFGQFRWPRRGNRGGRAPVIGARGRVVSCGAPARAAASVSWFSARAIRAPEAPTGPPPATVLGFDSGPRGGPRVSPTITRTIGFAVTKGPAGFEEWRRSLPPGKP